MKKQFTWAFLLLSCFYLNIAYAETTESKDDNPYILINPAQPVAVPDKLEVVELFWYTCPHCYYFDPTLEKWIANKPEDVNFIRIPAIFSNGRFINLAQVYYTAEALGVLDKIHTPLFEAIHKDKREFKGTDDFAKFFEEHGVARTDFEKKYASFAVDSRVRKARRLTAKYGISAVPSIVVQGKYLLTSDKTDGYENMMVIIDKLLDEARQEKAKP